MDKELTCDDCYESFEILTESDSQICYCPFCGSEMDINDSEDDDNDDEEWDDQDNSRFR
jgi:hypothetical protein